MPKEAQIIRTAQQLLTRRGAWHIKTHGTGAGRNGTPDIIATYRGRSLALEAKQPGRKPTRLQQHELDSASAAGAISAVITSRTDIKRILDEIDLELDGNTTTGPRWEDQ